MTAPCAVDECDRDAHARGWCTKHYQRWKRHGDPVTLIVIERAPECAADGCSRPPRRTDYCGAHYARLLRHGDPLGGGPTRAETGRACTNRDCHLLARVNGRCRRHDRAHRMATDPAYVERRRQEWRDWRNRNAGAAAESSRRRRRLDKRRFRRLMAWKLDNPWHASAYSYAKRRRMYGLPDDVAEQVIPGEVYERDCGLCQLCSRPVDRDLPFPHPESMTLDHRIPVSDPASEHSYANVQLAHWRCNRDRQARPLATALGTEPAA